MYTVIQHATRPTIREFAAVGRLFRHLRARRRRIARIEAELHAYSDRELAELDLRRSDIPAVARGSRQPKAA